MKSIHLVTSTALCALLAGAVFAVQDGGRDPGERRASTSLVVSKADGDEIILSYQTLHYSDGPINNMRENAEARQQWARFIPQLMQAELSTDVDLKWRQYTLPAGTYGLGMGMNDDGGWDLYLMRGDRRAGRLPLDVQECPLSFEYLTMNLMSAGQNSFQLMLGYGKMAAVVPFEAAPAED